MTQDSSSYSLSEDLINQIINYLAQQPYIEVFQLIQRVQEQIVMQSATSQAATMVTAHKENGDDTQ